MTPRSRFASFSRKPSRKARECAAVMWALGCRDEKLVEMTAEELAKRHGMKLADAGALLADARERRGL